MCGKFAFGGLEPLGKWRSVAKNQRLRLLNTISPRMFLALIKEFQEPPHCGLALAPHLVHF